MPRIFVNKGDELEKSKCPFGRCRGPFGTPAVWKQRTTTGGAACRLSQGTLSPPFECPGNPAMQSKRSRVSRQSRFEFLPLRNYFPTPWGRGYVHSYTYPCPAPPQGGGAAGVGQGRGRRGGMRTHTANLPFSGMGCGVGRVDVYTSLAQPWRLRKDVSWGEGRCKSTFNDPRPPEGNGGAACENRSSRLLS
jgi:hypothetical protein